MGLFDIFRKQPYLEDDIFGMIKYTGRVQNPADYFEGNGFFKPAHKQIDFLIDADITGPTQAQKDFFRQIEQRYHEIKLASLALVNDEISNRDEKQQIPFSEFDAHFDLEAISLKRITTAPVKWSISYYVDRLQHWAEISFRDFEAYQIHIDG